MDKHPGSTKIMILGFDGASWNILKPMMEKGQLPYFSRLMENGVSGRLKSTVPPLSGPAWASFATGKNPGKHGIYDFFRNAPKGYAATLINSSFFSTKTLWEVLSEKGKKVGIMNMLFTYPLPAVNGFVVSGRGTPGEKVSYTYPEKIKDEILAFEPRYRVGTYPRISQTGHFLSVVLEEIRRQERVNRFLFHRYPCDFTASYFGVPDVIQHIFWHYLDPAHPNYNKKKADRLLPLIEKCYQMLDSIIGQRLEMMDEDTILLVLSDHGAGPLHKTVQLNKILQEMNLFFLKAHCKKKTRTFIVFLGKIIRLFLGVFSPYDFLGLRRRIGFKTREKRGQAARKMFIDWSKTKAYAGRSAECGIHINLKGREGEGIVEPGEEYEQVRDFVRAELSRLKDAESGQRVMEHVWKREDIYHGSSVGYAPDLILDFGDRPYLGHDGLFAEKVLENIPPGGVTGKHQDNGVFFAVGKGVKKDFRIEGASICDLMPTILFLMGVEIPRDIDGKVLTEMLLSPISQKEIRFSGADGDSAGAAKDKKEVIYSEEETEKISRRLKDLGYL